MYFYFCRTVSKILNVFLDNQKNVDDKEVVEKKISVLHSEESGWDFLNRAANHKQKLKKEEVE